MKTLVANHLFKIVYISDINPIEETSNQKESMKDKEDKNAINEEKMSEENVLFESEDEGSSAPIGRTSDGKSAQKMSQRIAKRVCQQ